MRRGLFENIRKNIPSKTNGPVNDNAIWCINCPFFFSHGSTALVGLGLLIVEVSISHSYTPHVRASLDRDNTQIRETSMSLAAFEPAIATSEGPQNHDFHCAKYPWP